MSYDVSDEDFLNLPFPEVTGNVDDNEEVVEDDSNSEEILDESDNEIEGDVSTEEETEQGVEEETIEEDLGSEEETEESSSEETQITEEPSIDYKAEYEKLLQPFKANGQEFKVENIEEAIRLMQMGVGFNKKAATIKPYMKTIRTLEEHGLLDEGRLNFLIDLDKKNPEAIKKLLKDSSIDPLDLDLEQTNYRPTNHTVSEAQVNLAEIVDEVKDTPTGAQALNVVANVWDAQSRDIVAKQPAVLKAINDHMALGIYDKIASQVQRERTLGRLIGMSDLDAYKMVGDQLHASGAFNAPAPVQTQQQATQVRTPAPTSKPSAAKKAASIPSNKGKSNSTSKPKINFDVSDEDFLKINPKFL